MADESENQEEFKDGEEGSGTSGADKGKGIGDKVSDIPFTDVDASKLKIKGVGDDSEEEEEEEDDKKKSASNSQDVTDKDEEEEEEEEKDKEEEEEEEEEESDDDKAGKDAKAKGKEGEPEKQSYTQQEFQESVNKMIATVTKSGAKTLADIPKILTEKENKISELTKALGNKEIEFPNERAKLLYNYSVKAAGFETQAAKQYLHVAGLGPIKDLSDKGAQFESFCLSRPDLSREKAQVIFDKKYETTYTDLENDVLQQDNHGTATREAKEKLSKMQEDFDKSEVKSKSEQPADESIDPKISEAIHKQVDEAFDGFEGMTVPIGEGSDDKVSLKLNEEEVSKFKEFVKKPYDIIDTIADECLDDNGNLDVEKWMYELLTIFKRHTLATEANKLGRTLGQVGLIKGKKSADKRKAEGDGSGARGKKLSFEETFVKAVQTN